MTETNAILPAEVLLANLGRLDNRPETLAALQRGLDDAWAALERAAEGELS